MPITVIAGTFQVVGQTRTGNPSGFEPDGDSIQFRPTDPNLLDRLPILDSPVRLTSIGSTQLRMEGIDALEIHFAGSHQPRPLADQGRDALTDRLGLAPISYREADGSPTCCARRRGSRPATPSHSPGVSTQAAGYPSQDGVHTLGPAHWSRSITGPAVNSYQVWGVLPKVLIEAARHRRRSPAPPHRHVPAAS
jgi:hypothetical protein